MSKKSATTTTTPFQSLINLKPSDVNHCEGDDCPDIADAFIQLQSEMKTQLEEKERQAEINSNLAAENDEKNAAIFQLESIKQKQMALITNLQDKEDDATSDDNTNIDNLTAETANLKIQIANFKSEKDQKMNTIIANMQTQQENDQTAINANLSSQLAIKNNIIANLTGARDQKNAIILSQQSQQEKLNATIVDLQSQQRNQTAANSNLQFQLGNQTVVTTDFQSKLAKKIEDVNKIRLEYDVHRRYWNAHC